MTPSALEPFGVSRPLGLRTLLIFMLWFGAALLITELVANALRESQVSQRAASEYQPPSTPPTFYRRGAGADGRQSHVALASHTH